MQIDITHHIDANEPDPAGMHEWRYEYDLFRFSEAEQTYVARGYATESDEVHFLRAERSGKARVLDDADLASPLFNLAVQHLKNSGKRKIMWFSDTGYREVPPGASR